MAVVELNSTDLPRLPRRPLDAYKTSAGSVLAVVGSYGMAGAACLAASSTLKSGAGYVRLACPKSIYPILATLVPSAVFIPLDVDGGGMVLASEAEKITDRMGPSRVAAIGCGLGTSDGAAGLFHALMERLDLPKVLDANALGLLGKSPQYFARLTAEDVLTPHPGEMGELLGICAGDVQKDRRAAVLACCERTGAVAVLKGARTLVSDGRRLYVNTSGNAGMAKAGSGDVLTGIIAALVAQGLAAFDAAALGVYVHGKAGDLAGRGRGRGLMAEDIVQAIPAAMLALEGGVFETGRQG